MGRAGENRSESERDKEQYIRNQKEMGYQRDDACSWTEGQENPHSLSEPITRGPISLTIRSPFAVNGMSVTPVCAVRFRLYT